MGGPTLPDGTGLSIEKYRVTGIPEFAKEMAEKDLAKPKVALQFEIDTSGLTRLVKAEAVVEEIVMVEEEVEVEDDEEEEEGKKDKNATEAKEEKKDEEGEKKDESDEGAASEKDGEAKNGETEEGAASDDKKEEGEKEEKKEEKKEKKKKTKMVQKEKKKKHVRTLEVSSYHTGDIRPYSPELMAESKAKLALLAKADEERVQLEESKNKFESYIYHIRNRLIDDEELIAKVSTEEQRAALSKSAEDAEEWMFDDGYTADLATVEAKYDELSGPAIKVFFRAAELTARPKAVEALTDKLTKIEELMKKWETTMTHITEEERTEVLDKVKEVRAWVEEQTTLQEATDASEDPVFTSAEVPGQTKRIESLVSRLLKKKKPKPPEKNETETNATDANTTDAAPEGESTPEGETTDETSESSEEGATNEEGGASSEEETKSETPDGAEKTQEESAEEGGAEDEF